jgi:hypothetical protein
MATRIADVAGIADIVRDRKIETHEPYANRVKIAEMHAKLG